MSRLKRHLLLTLTLTLFAAAAACDSGSARTIEIVVDSPSLQLPVERFVEFLPYPSVEVLDGLSGEGGDAGDDVRIHVIVDLIAACDDCYRLDLDAATGVLTVHGKDRLGAQYGLAHALELAGFRFHNPWRTIVPAEPALPAAGDPAYGVVHEPEMAVRGIRPHTIHPIEAYYAFWEPEAQHLKDARRIIDWTIKNRGNYLEWVALDDIVEASAEARDAWRSHTGAILSEARGRGLRVGIAIQLYGSSNLQRGFDLIDDNAGDHRTQIAERLAILFEGGLAWDAIDLSFGEFFAADADLFIADVNTVLDEARKLAPAVELAATIHVGNDPEQRLTYMGEELQYYFLVKFADPDVVPYVHTTMYYTLFDDAGGAYEHDEFNEHRDFLLARLEQAQRVAYFPESAYWVAFDNSVPIYLPLYVRSRWRDLDEIRKATTDSIPPRQPLEEHVLFSSGWEWGYWQQDIATLRMGFRLEDPRMLFQFMFEPYGGMESLALADALSTLADAQHQGLIVQRLAAYLAGRDLYIDLGDETGIYSQPDRPGFDELAAAPPAERQAFRDGVLANLETLLAAHQTALAAVQVLSLPADDPFIAEIIDGLEVDIQRIRAISACYRAALAFADGGAGGGLAELAEAEAAVAEARVIVTRRHAALHYPRPEQLLEQRGTATLYGFGYLWQTAELCYWERELAQLRVLLGTDAATPPACVL